MKKKYLFIMSIMVIILMTIIFYITTNQNKDDNGVEQNTNQSKVAPFVRTADDLPTEMLYADYWISRQQNPTEIIMSEMEIAIWNQEFVSQSKGYSMGFGNFISDERQVVLGEDVYDYISNMYQQPNENVYDENGEVLTADFWQQLFYNRNLDGIINEQEISYAYTVNRASIRALPYEGLVTNEQNNNFFCQLQVSSILMNEPVVILHESSDSEWYFIVTRYCAGWIKKENVAICQSFAQWKNAMNPEDFLMVTGNKEILDVDMEHHEASELILYMGTKLELIEYEQYEITENARVPFECYIVKVPIRNASGMLEYQYAFVPISRDVHIGYLPYTVENLINQMFKINGDRYGWGGMYNARDCSQYIMEIYRLFGFHFARNSTAQAMMPFDGYDLEEVTDKEKMKILDKTPVGSILYFQGHVMMYLGKVDDEYYVISETARIIQDDLQGQLTDNVNESESKGIINAHSCMITPLSIKRPNGKTWLSELSAIKCVK